MDNETDEINTPKPPRKGLFPEDEKASPLELAVLDTYRFLKSEKGRSELADVEYAKWINPRFAAQIYSDAMGQTGRRLRRKADSPETLQVVKQKLWRHTLPSGKNKVYFRFLPGSGKLFKWGAFSLIELPKGISAHRKKGGRLFLAIDYLDTYDGQPSPDMIVGKLDQWTLFTEHVFDRLMQRLPEANLSELSAALKQLPRLMLEAEGKALIEDNEGRSFLAVKTPYGCLYFAGYLRVREGTAFRFYKTVFSEPELYSSRRNNFRRIAATSDTWSDEHMSVQGWTKMPIIGHA